MELVLPGLIILLLSAFFVFMVVPRMGSTVLAVTSLIALILAGIQHYSMFYSEYKLSTWQASIAGYGPLIVLGLALLFIVSATFSALFGATSQNSLATPIDVIAEAVSNIKNGLPSAASATNAVTSNINHALSTIAPNNSSRTNTSRSNNSTKTSLIPELGYRASEV
jgi:ABC-type transport system involved in multi-copper enzyme maturation permease subunit